MSLRDRLRAAMEAKGYSARKLALEAKLADTTVSKFLSGSTRSITIENLEKCAEVLGVSMRHLMFDEPDADNISSIWQRIPKENRAQARAVLRTFERKDGTA